MNYLRATAVAILMLWFMGFCVGSVVAQGTGTTGGVASGTTVYFGSDNGTLHAVNADTGDEIWEFTKPSKDNTITEPIIVDGTIYFGSNSGTLYAVDADTGDEVWNFTKPSGEVAPPTVVNDTLYSASADDTIYVVDADTGDEIRSIRSSSLNFIGGKSATVVNGNIRLSRGRAIGGGGSSDSTVYKINASTGDVLRTLTVPKISISQPIVAYNNVYFDTTGHDLFKVGLDTVDNQWGFSGYNGRIYVGSQAYAPAVVNGTVYFRASEALHAVDSLTGDEMWEFGNLSGDVESTPTVMDGKIYVGSRSDNDNDTKSLYAVDADTGEKEWRVLGSVGLTPTATEETVYFRSNDNTLYAVNASDGTEKWMFSESTTSATVVKNPVNGDSIDSRVKLGINGHHNAYAERADQDTFVANIDYTNSPEENETLRIRVRIKNTGNKKSSQTITLTNPSLGSDSINITLSGGASTYETFKIPTEWGDEGDYKIKFSDGSEYITSKDSVDVSIRDVPPEFDVSINSTNLPIKPNWGGELQPPRENPVNSTDLPTEINVEAKVTNTGGESDNQTVKARFIPDLTGGRPLRPGNKYEDTVSVALDRGESIKKEFSITISDYRGTGKHALTVGSEDDRDRTVFLITEEPVGQFNITDITGPDSPVTEGDTVQIEAEIENTGEENTRNMGLGVAGVGKVDDKDVTLSEGESKTVTLKWDVEIPEGTPSERDIITDGVPVAVYIPGNIDIEGGERPDNIKLTSIPVGASESFDIKDITITEPELPVTEGDTVQIEAEINKTGNEETEDVGLSIEDIGEIDSESVTMSGGESKTVTLEWDVEESVSGVLNATVSAGSDSEITSIPIEGGSATLAGTVRDDEGNVIEGVEIEVVYENNGTTVANLVTDGTGRWSTKTAMGTYTVTATRGGKEKTRSGISHDDAYTHVSMQLDDVSLCDGEEFIISPESPATYQSVNLIACDAGGKGVEWKVDGSEIAEGRNVVHSFDASGTHRVTAKIGGRQYSKSVDVEEAEFAIKEVEKVEHEGKAVSDTPMNLKYDVRLEKSEFLNAAVYVSSGILDDEISVEKKSGDEWRVRVDGGDISSGRYTIGINAESDSLEDSWDSEIRVFEIPDSVNWMTADLEDEVDKGNVGEESPEDIVLPSDTFAFKPWNLVLFDTGAGWSIPVSDGLKPWEGDGLFAESRLAIQSGITLPETNLNLGISGEGEGGALGKNVAGEVEGSTAIKPPVGSNTEWDFESLEFEAEIRGKATPWKIDIKAAGTGFEVDVEVGIEGKLDGKFENEISIETLDASIAPGGSITARTGTEFPGGEAEVSGGGSVSPGIELDLDGKPSFLKEIFISGKVSFTARGQAFFYEGSQELTLVNIEGKCIAACGTSTTSALSTDSTRLMASGDTPSNDSVITFSPEDFSVASKGGEQPPELDLSSNYESHDRLSNRRFKDSHPSVDVVGDRRVVVWSSQDEEKDVVEGRDIVYRTRDGGSGGWSETASVTDDTFHDQKPEIASGGDESALSAWTRVGKDASEERLSFSEAANSTGVGFALYDSASDSWSDVKTTGSDGAAVSNIVVDGNENGWIVAWERREGGLFDPDSKSVRFGYVDENGSMVATDEIEDASMPDVSMYDESPHKLAYYKESDGDEGEIVVSDISVSNGVSTTETERYGARDPGGFSISGSRIVWGESQSATEQLIYYTNTQAGRTPKAVETDANISRIDDMVFKYDEEDSRGILVYRGRNGLKQEKRDIAYRMLDGEGWVADRRITSGKGTNVTFLHPDVASAEDGFILGYSAKEFGQESVGDIFVTKHEYLPEFTVESSQATDKKLEAGEIATIDYTVRNVGDSQAEDIPVVLEGDRRVLSRETIDSLEVNETESGSFQAPVSESGKYTVSVDPDNEINTIFDFGEEDNWMSRSDETVVAEPNVYVDDAEATRMSDGFVRVNISLVNEGGASVEGLKLGLKNGGEIVTNTTVTQLSANSSEYVEAFVESSELNSSSTQYVVLDPESEFDDSVFRSRESLQMIFTPDVAVHDPVRYERYVEGGEERLFVSTLVENRGEAPANARVLVEKVNSNRGTRLGPDRRVSVGDTTVDIQPALDGVPVFKRVKVPINLDLESGDRVRVSAITESYDPDVTGRSIVDTVRISPPISPLVSVVDTGPFNKWSEIEVLRADLKDGPISLPKEGTTDRIDSLANVPRMGEDLVLENIYLKFDERRASFNVSGVKTTEAKSEIESSVIGYLEIKKELSSTADVESIFKFSTTEGILESMDINQNDVSLYRYDEGNESWIELPTSIRGNGFKSGNDLRSYIGFEADSSRLSTTFAVAGEFNEEVAEEPSEKSEEKNKCVDRRSLGRGGNDDRCTGDRNFGRGERDGGSDRRSRGRNRRNR